MADSVSNRYLSVAEAIDDLRPLGISVDCTDQQVDLTNAPDENGHVVATVGLLTVTANGRVFAELYDSSDNVRLTMLDHLADDAERLVREGRRAGYLRCLMDPETVLELREWAELRDQLLVGA